MKLLISGSSGLVGSHLCQKLDADPAYEAVRLVRKQSAEKQGTTVMWQPGSDCMDLSLFAGIDAVIHLGGVNIADKRWSPEIKQKIYNSRVQSTSLLANSMAQLEQPSGEFVPNDVLLGEPYGCVQIITGPNMAGKSTYIRQAALLTLMAQIGSFIPASEARIGIADRIFARVGASDELSKGQSTFMVEMTEAARILNSASERSLVILDEIGRGTSTYDGISLAWSMTEFLHDKIKARTLFATHYHELTELTQTLKQASNWNVAVHEQDGEIVFLHKIVEGSANKSYGIHVARLAGIPDQVIQRANQILSTLEKDHIDETGQTTIPPRIDRKSSHQQLSLFGNTAHPVLDEIRDLNVDEMTPLAALEELYRIREQLN
ncbi:MAG TPA: hypothetical protein DCY03_18350 [Planctomycetaceae bacterium]|nr:hypothetical protein [Planctomycetaceae bacterium]